MRDADQTLCGRRDPVRGQALPRAVAADFRELHTMEVSEGGRAVMKGILQIPIKWWLVCAALVLRLGVYSFIPSVPVQDDTRYYYGIAKSIIAGWGYSFDHDFDGIPEVTTREPGLPSFLAAILMVSKDKALQLATVIQILLNALATLAVFEMGSALFSNRAGLIGALLYAVYPGLVVESTVLGHEGLLLPLLIIGLFLVVEATRRNSYEYFFVAGIALGLAVIIKQSTLGVPAVVGVAAVASGLSLPRPRTGCLIMGISFLLVIAPWAARSFRVRQIHREMVRQVLPQVERASVAEMRLAGGRVHKLLEGLKEEKSLRTTVLAKVAYDLYEGDPRRPLPIFSASGGEIEAMLLRPALPLQRIFATFETPGRIASVFLVPYESRYVNFVLPDTPRLKKWREGAPTTPGIHIKLLLIVLLLWLHCVFLTGCVIFSRRRTVWPLLAVASYFYLVPLIHSAPLNRFFFPVLPLLIIVSSGVLDGAIEWWRSRAELGLVVVNGVDRGSRQGAPDPN